MFIGEPSRACFNGRHCKCMFFFILTKRYGNNLIKPYQSKIIRQFYQV